MPLYGKHFKENDESDKAAKNVIMALTEVDIIAATA